MPVFVSHKREDKDKALEISSYLQRCGVACYVDILDPALKTTDDITDTIMRRVKQCTHLMAIVSAYTERSWWVPFEIGVASEIERRICSFQAAYASLPEFLKKWPILKNQAHLEVFVQNYRNDTAVPITEGRLQSPTILSAAQFHRELKARL